MRDGRGLRSAVRVSWTRGSRERVQLAEKLRTVRSLKTSFAVQALQGIARRDVQLVSVFFGLRDKLENLNNMLPNSPKILTSS